MMAKNLMGGYVRTLQQGANVAAMHIRGDGGCLWWQNTTELYHFIWVLIGMLCKAVVTCLFGIFSLSAHKDVVFRSGPAQA
jgi:hypothetical protein